MRGLWIALVVTACGGMSYDEFTRKEDDAYCAYEVRCHLAHTVEFCLEELAAGQLFSPNVPAALKAGIVEYDEDAADRCLDAWDALSCESILPGTDSLAHACDDVLSGTLDNGQECGFDLECQSGRCAVPDCEEACCKGICAPAQPLPATGEPCTTYCAGDAYCGLDSTCHDPLPSGAACDNYSWCEAGLYCAGASQTTAGTCTPAPHIGEPCDSRCAEFSAICLNNVCTQQGVAGEPCTIDEECSSTHYMCDGSKCRPYPMLGQACTTLCSGNAYCAGVPKTCVAQQPDGETCMYNDQCASHFCNDSVCSQVALCI